MDGEALALAQMFATERGALIGKLSDLTLVGVAGQSGEPRCGPDLIDRREADGKMIAAAELEQHARPVSEEQQEPRRAHHAEHGHVLRAGGVADGDWIRCQNRRRPHPPHDLT